MLDISIVTGTYNRLGHLQQMIASARAAIAPPLTYEIIVVDGGSPDETIHWCKQQPDVKLIEHGALLGGLKAFGDGARAASGSYVILANDDIIFKPGSITRAYVHLQTHPSCGQVAFSDNRAAPGYGNDYHVQTSPVQIDGQVLNLPYAQVSMTRIWLGDDIGWWGDEHPVMGQGHTYGGDNFLSAGVWERGYTVDAVDGATVDDLVADDLLRAMNTEAERARPAVYYKVYSAPPVFNSKPLSVNFPDEQLRIMLLTLYEPGYGKYKAGLRLALERIGQVWEVDYLNEPYNLPEMVAQWQPHLLLTQLHSAEAVTAEALAAARSWAPAMTVVNWNGDVYADKLTSPAMLHLLRHVDLQLVVNQAVIPIYARHGIRSAYWQVAYEPVQEPLPVVAAHDVVWLANCYSAERRALGDLLRAMGVNVGLYGSGWHVSNGNTTYNFAAGAALYQRAKIAIGDNQYPDQRGFVSNRLFEALGNGAFLLQQHVEGLEELTGLKSGQHYVEWHDTEELQALIKYYVTPRKAAERNRIANAGYEFVQQHHSFDARVVQLFEQILPGVFDAVLA